MEERASTETSTAADALVAWPRRLESLTARLDSNRTEHRSELRAAEDQALKQAELIKDLSSRTEKGEAALRSLADRVAAEATKGAATEAAAAEAAQQAADLRRAVEAAESAMQQGQ